MNANISVFAIYVEWIVYLLLYNLHDCFFNSCYRIHESWFLIRVMRTVEKEMSWSFDIITTTANRVKLICKTMFEIVLAKMT